MKTRVHGTQPAAVAKTLPVAPDPVSPETIKLTSKLGERGQVVIPKQIRDRLKLGHNTEIEFELRDDVLTMHPKKDMAAFRKHLEKWRGAMAGDLQRDGYKSVDEYMRVMRGR